MKQKLFAEQRRKLSPRVVLGVVVGTVALVGLAKLALGYLPSHAGEHVKKGEQLALNGGPGIPACVGCHGANGEGSYAAGIPRLAGLHPGYIEKQLKNFARDPVKTRVDVDPIVRDYNRTPRTYGDLTVFTPGTRRDPVMNEIARKLSKDDIGNLAVYFGQLPFVAPTLAYDFETLERGEDLAKRGKPEYGLPACDSCHGDKGAGFGPVFPPLAGQPPKYVIKQLNNWQTKQRDNDNLALMRNVADQLTDGDKENIAAYYSNQSYSINQ